MSTHTLTSQQELDNKALVILVVEKDGYETTYRLSLVSASSRTGVGIQAHELQALQGQIDLILGNAVVAD